MGERISELKDRAIEKIQVETQREKELKKKKIKTCGANSLTYV